MMRNFAFGLAALGAAIAAPSAATTITNVPAWDGSTYIIYFGYPDTTNYGQSFVSPGGNLTSVTFQFVDGSVGDVKLFVSEWTGTTEAAAPIYESSVVSYAGGLQAISFSLDLATTAGASYIAYLSVAGVDSPVTNVSVGGTYGDTIADGGFYYINTGGVAPNVGDWWSSWSIPDTAFTAEFTDGVPEPATWAMLITGFGLVGATMRRRRLANA